MPLNMNISQKAIVRWPTALQFVHNIYPYM